MLGLKYERHWHIAGILLLGFAMTAALLPEFRFWYFDPNKLFKFSDKVLHVATFMFLSTWFSGQYNRRAYWRITAGLLAFGALIELIQGTVSYRSSEWQDLYADGLGIAIGLSIALLGAGGWSLRVERWLDRNSSR